MSGSCCAKPIATIIKVGDSEAGIQGLEAAFHNVYVSGLSDEELIKSELLKWAREFGNYIAASAEGEYAKALLGEYRQYVETIKDSALPAANRDEAEPRGHFEHLWKSWFKRKRS